MPKLTKLKDAALSSHDLVKDVPAHGKAVGLDL